MNEVSGAGACARAPQKWGRSSISCSAAVSEKRREERDGRIQLRLESSRLKTLARELRQPNFKSSFGVFGSFAIFFTQDRRSHLGGPTAVVGRAAEAEAWIAVRVCAHLDDVSVG
jgi:hypothetical protein